MRRGRSGREADWSCSLPQDDVDTLVFGATTVIRNLSAGLSGYAFNPSSQPNASADPSIDATSSSYGKHTLAIYHSRRVQSTTSLDRSALILIALISGGDYLPEGIPRAGPISTLALAKLGFGSALLEGLAKHRASSDADREAFLAGWREDVAMELETNRGGFLSRREKALANRVRAEESFPCLQAVADYEHPVVSADRNRKIDWYEQVDMPRLVGWCSDRFEWPVEEIVDKLRNSLWKVLAHHHLRLVALQMDSTVPRLLSPSPLSKAKLMLAVHDYKTSDATSFVPAYRVELDPAPLLHLIVPHLPCPDPHAVAEDDPRRLGIEGASPGKKQKLKTMEKTGRASCSHWIGEGFVCVGEEGRRLVEEWREGVEGRRRRKEEVDGRRRAKDGRIAFPVTKPATTKSTTKKTVPEPVVRSRPPPPVDSSDDESPVARPPSQIKAPVRTTREPVVRSRPPPPVDSDEDDAAVARLLSLPKASSTAKRAHSKTTPPPPVPNGGSTTRPAPKGPRKVAPPPPDRPSKAHGGAIYLDLSDSDLESDDLPERIAFPAKATVTTKAGPDPLRPVEPNSASRNCSTTSSKAPTKGHTTSSGRIKVGDPVKAKSSKAAKGGASVRKDWSEVEVLDLSSD